MDMDPGFSAERMARLVDLDAHHFWFVERRRLVQSLITQHLPNRRLTIADIGCGAGSMLTWLTAQGHSAVGFDAHRFQLALLLTTNPQLLCAQASALHLPLPDESLDAVLILDVLEHLDDVAALAELRRVLRPSAHMVVSVPAMPSLFGQRDVDAGHLRRYTCESLCLRLTQAGFTILATQHYQFLLLPLFILTRFFGRNRAAARDQEDTPPPHLNRLLGAVNRLEVGLSSWLRWPLGSSVIAVVKRG